MIPDTSLLQVEDEDKLIDVLKFKNGCYEIDFITESAALVKIQTDGPEKQIIIGRQRNFKVLTIEAEPSSVNLKPRYAFPMTNIRLVGVMISLEQFYLFH